MNKEEKAEQLAKEKAEQLANLITVAQQRKGDLKKSDLVKIAKEMNGVIKPNPLLRTRGTVEDILSDIVECTIIVEDIDELEKFTLDILNHLGMGQILADAKLIPKEEVVDVNAEPGQEEPPETEPETEGSKPTPEEVAEAIKKDQKEMGVKDSSEETLPEEETDESGPVMSDKDLDPDEEPVVPVVPDEPLDDDEPAEKPRLTIKDMTPEELLQFIADDRAAKRGKRDGTSNYMKSYPVFCKHYELGFEEALVLVAKEIGITVTSQNKPGMRTAHSQVRKTVRFLRKYGHLPEEGKKKAASPRKPAKKKADESK